MRLARAFSMLVWLAGTLIALVGCRPPTPRMVNNGDGTVTDNDTCLMWLATPPNNQLTWSDANQWAEDLDFAGHQDWRLPSALNRSDGLLCDSSPTATSPGGHNCSDTEFATLYFNYGWYKVLNDGVFQEVPYAGSYWTATEFPQDTTQAMFQEMADGGQFPKPKDALLPAWAVRTTCPAQ